MQPGLNRGYSDNRFAWTCSRLLGPRVHNVDLCAKSRKEWHNSMTLRTVDPSS